MGLRQITEHVFLVEGENRGRFPFSHSVFIRDEKNALIDTGCGAEACMALRRRERVDLIVNSHSHADHSAGNWMFEGMPLHVPREEFEFSGDLMKLSLRYAEGEFQEIWRDLVRTRMGFRDSSPTHAFGDANVFELGETRLEAVHAPGHTVGHYCFFVRGEGILLSSDIDCTPFGPWYGNEESSIRDFKSSIEKVRSLPSSVVLPSHMEPIEEDITEAFDSFARVFDARDQRILALLEKERTLGELVECAPIYGQKSFAEVPLGYWEKKMVEKHLALLLEAGRVRKDGAKYRRV